MLFYVFSSLRILFEFLSIGVLPLIVLVSLCVSMVLWEPESVN